MKPEDIIKSFKSNDMTYDDMINICLLLKKQFEDAEDPEEYADAIEALQGLALLILDKKKQGRSIYPIKQEILKFFLLILKKYT